MALKEAKWTREIELVSSIVNIAIYAAFVNTADNTCSNMIIKKLKSEISISTVSFGFWLRI